MRWNLLSSMNLYGDYFLHPTKHYKVNSMSLLQPQHIFTFISTCTATSTHTNFKNSSPKYVQKFHFREETLDVIIFHITESVFDKYAIKYVFFLLRFLLKRTPSITNKAWKLISYGVNDHIVSYNKVQHIYIHRRECEKKMIYQFKPQFRSNERYSQLLYTQVESKKLVHMRKLCTHSVLIDKFAISHSTFQLLIN